MKTLLPDSSPKLTVGAITPDPADLDSLVLAAARVLDAHMLAVTTLLELEHDCFGCLECTFVLVLEERLQEVLTEVATVLIGIGEYRFAAMSDAYDDARERAETLAADRAAARLTEHGDTTAQSASYAEALERAEPAVAEKAADRMPWEAIECNTTSPIFNLAEGLPQRSNGATIEPSSREYL